MHPMSTQTPTNDATASTSPTSRTSRRITHAAAAAVVGCAVSAISLLQACSFSAPQVQTPQDVYDILDESRYVTPYAGDRWTVIDDAKLRVEHGWSCAEAPRAASQEYIGRVGGFSKLPPKFDGTVFLNAGTSPTRRKITT